jgi:hypothetical protein
MHDNKQKPIKFKYATGKKSSILKEVEEPFIQKSDTNNEVAKIIKQKSSHEKKKLPNYIDAKDLLQEKIINFKNNLIISLTGKNCQDCGIDDPAVLMYDCFCTRDNYLKAIYATPEEISQLISNSNIRCLNCHRRINNI